MTDNELLSTRQDPDELADNVSETARALFSAGSVTDTLQRVVDLAVKTIEGCDFAGIFLLDGGAISTPAHTDSLVIDIDALQHATAEGPCLDAISSGKSLYADDLIDDGRWPRFGPRATAAGIRSALAFALSANDTRGALNLYAHFPRAFGVGDRAKGQILATLGALALAVAEDHEAEERRVLNLEAALVTREMIGQAQGILIERERITAEQAFEVLRRASQHLNIRLRDVAQDLIETGERPATGPRPVP
jgi:hypothetical protein